MSDLTKCHNCGKEQHNETIGFYVTLYNISLCSRCRYNLAIRIKGSPEGKAWPTYEEIFEEYLK